MIPRLPWKSVYLVEMHGAYDVIESAMLSEVEKTFQIGTPNEEQEKAARLARALFGYSWAMSKAVEKIKPLRG